MILSQSEEDLLSVGNTINAKKRPYYRSGMIYMKWGEYDKAINGFTEALKLTFDKENDNKWWNAHYYRRLGLVYLYKGDYVNASKNYLKSFRLYEKLDDNKKYSIKALCSYGFVEELLENHDLAKEKMMECSSWVLENQKGLENDHDAYETIWPLYLYYNKINQQQEASKYLTLAYESIGSKTIEQYHTHPRKDTDPRFFYCRNIIKQYDTSLNQ